MDGVPYMSAYDTDTALRATSGLSTNVPVDWVPLVAGPAALAKPIRAIRVETEGTVTVTTPGGAGRVMRFLAGETRLVLATHVTAATATGLEGAV